MADEMTPRLNLVKPEVGGSADTWGDKWNENADKIDAAIIKPDEENVWSAPQHFDGGLYAGETNPTDTTPGRVLKVGDFGVGATIWIKQGENLNDFTTPGEYHQSTNANAIPELNYPAQLAGSLKVMQAASGVVQEYTTYGSNRRKFLRGMYGGSWSSWVEFYNTGNIAQLISDGNLVQTSRTISTGTGLTGGGNLSANRTISLASSHIPIGVGQTWRDVKGSRSLGTTYTNTTGRAIMVSISLPDTNNKTPTVTINVGGVNILVNTYDGGNNLGSFSHSFIVPAGATYRISVNDSVGITTWAELR